MNRVRLAALAGHGAQNVRELYLSSTRSVKYFFIGDCTIFVSSLFVCIVRYTGTPTLTFLFPAHGRNTLAFFLQISLSCVKPFPFLCTLNCVSLDSCFPAVKLF